MAVRIQYQDKIKEKIKSIEKYSIIGLNFENETTKKTETQIKQMKENTKPKSINNSPKNIEKRFFNINQRIDTEFNIIKNEKKHSSVTSIKNKDQNKITQDNQKTNDIMKAIQDLKLTPKNTRIITPNYTINHNLIQNPLFLYNNDDHNLKIEKQSTINNLQNKIIHTQKKEINQEKKLRLSPIILKGFKALNNNFYDPIKFSEQKKNIYEPHSLKEYKELNSINMVLNGLGPNIGNEKWQEKVEKNRKINNFSLIIKEKNKIGSKTPKQPPEVEIKVDRVYKIEDSSKMKAGKYENIVRTRNLTPAKIKRIPGKLKMRDFSAENLHPITPQSKGKLIIIDQSRQNTKDVQRTIMTPIRCSSYSIDKVDSEVK